MTLLAQIYPVRLFHEWPWLEGNCDVPDLLSRLIQQTAIAYRITGTEAGVVLSVGRTKDSGVVALWIMSLFGKVGLRPKANRELMADVLAEVTQLAARVGCDEIRVEPGDRPDWKLRLLPSMGFERLDLGTKTAMRKAI